MKNSGYLSGSYGVFDVAGPVMVGPSSSHTAGAARLGKMARMLAHNSVRSVEFRLYGSFAQTYMGHGTDKALLAGILGFEPWDERLRESFRYAQEMGVEYSFVPCTGPSEGERFLITAQNGEKFDITGCSVGGGKVRIVNLNGIAVSFTGESPILVTRHYDSPGIIASITALLYQSRLNIGNMRVNRKRQSDTADMYLEIDGSVPQEIVGRIREIPGMISVILMQ